LNASSGIEHGGQQCIVAGTLSGGPVDGLEYRVDLLVLQIIDHSLPGTFEWDAEDPLRQFQVLGVPGGDEVKERMYRGKPDVARRHAVLPFLFQVGEKGQDAWGIDIDEIELSDSLFAFGGKKAEQQDDAVPVAVDGVRARSAQPRQMISEVISNDCAEEIR
jgi:hypothetical protein